MKNALIIFIRNPEKGKVKSRLAKDLGEENTLTVYNFLLQFTRDICAKANASRFVFYSDNIDPADIWDENSFTKDLQKGNDLGERMSNAFSTVFNLGFENVLIIGSDCYELTTDHINQAFVQLENTDVVIGPSKDGGYYLLGMKKLQLELFINKNWGGDDVLKNTIDNLDQQKLKFIELPALNDIDTIEDISGTDILEKCNLNLPK
jgi:rSAM/selenodomain-associated transferase 1